MVAISASAWPRLTQTLLQNLLNNAADAVDQYMSELLSSGKPEDIELLMEIQDKALIGLQVTHNKNEIQIEVSNQGATIPEKHLESIFEQGFSKKKSGNGVGLYDVRQILRQSNGSISARNHENSVIFLVTLPRVDCDSWVLVR